MIADEMKQEALGRLLERPDRVGNLYNITREEILEAAGELVLKALAQGEGEHLGDIFTLPLSLAVNLSGMTKYQIQKEGKIIDLGRRNQRITYNNLKALLASKTKEPSS